MSGNMDLMNRLLTYGPAVDGTFGDFERSVVENSGVGNSHVLLGFAPKVGGTFLREVLIDLFRKQYQAYLARGSFTCCSQARDLHWPALLAQHVHPAGDRKSFFVMHCHLLANEVNRRLIELFRIPTVLMARNLLDTLVSYYEELEKRDEWFSDPILYADSRYATAPLAEKKQYIISIAVPWYLQYFCSWFEYEEECRTTGQRAPVWLTFDQLKDRPLDAIKQIAEHCNLGEKVNNTQVRRAFETVWAKRSECRFNKGINGRGETFFTKPEKRRIFELVDLYRCDEMEKLGIV